MARPKQIVVLLDGNADTLSVRTFLLENKGYRVLAASTAEEVLGLLRHWPAGALRVLVAKLAFTPEFAVSFLRSVKLQHPELGIVLLIDEPGAADAEATCVLSDARATVSELVTAVADVAKRRRGPRKAVAAALAMERVAA